VLGLTFALRAKGQMVPFSILGEGGLGGRTVKDLRAEMALVYCAFVGVVGGEKLVELGLDGEARGTMSLGS
jgi:hypothetical protein